MSAQVYEGRTQMGASPGSAPNGRVSTPGSATKWASTSFSTRPIPDRRPSCPNSFGLAFFVVSGAGIARQLDLPVLSVVVMGVRTGVAGGATRDVLTAEIPMILHGGELYATAAITGAAVFVALVVFGAPAPLPSLVGTSVIVALRLATIVWGLRLPSFSLDRE